MLIRSRSAILLVTLVLGGCAARTPRIVVGSDVFDLDALLAPRPVAATQEIRADELARTGTASYHLVQVVGRERPHRHAQHDLAVLVLRGHGTLTLGAATVRMRAGDAAVIPRDRPHWFRREGREPAVALAIFSPPLDAPDHVPEDDR